MGEDGTAGNQETKQEVFEPVLPPEERLWAVVKANPADFNAWTELIQETEKLDDLARIQTCYDAFLSEFPLCYGYWKKYADFEARLGTHEKTVEIYERAVKAVAHSVDIWLHYCTYMVEKHLEPAEVLRLFERAVSAAGADYLAHPLWDKYLEYAYSHLNDWNLVMQLHTRILEIPNPQLDRYLANFKNFASSKPWAQGSDKSRTGSYTLPYDGKELDRFITIREVIYRRTKEWDAKIRDFENAIRRPYFHVKALDEAQLANWHKYLDFLEKEANVQKVVKVYERCLIACATYPEYWIRYIEFLEKQRNFVMANEALIRATQIFVKRLPEIHLFAAKFKERRGDSLDARKTYNYLVNELAPSHLESIVMFAFFEKRQGSIEAAYSVFDSAIKSESEKEGSRTLPSLYVQYVRFLIWSGFLSKAKEILEAALQKLPMSKLVVLAAIEYETYNSGERQLKKLQEIVERATAAENTALSSADREEISNSFLEFMDSFGDINTLMDAEAQHEKLFPFRKTYVDPRKRLAHDDRKSSKTSIQAQWTGQGQAYQQGWQQQVPQWNAAYGQQQAAWYSSYGAQPAYGGAAAYAQQGYGTQDMNGWNTSAGATTAWY